MSHKKGNQSARTFRILTLIGILALVWIAAVFFQPTERMAGLADAGSSPSSVPISEDGSSMDVAGPGTPKVDEDSAGKPSATEDKPVLISDQPSEVRPAQQDTKRIDIAAQAVARNQPASEPRQGADEKIADWNETVSDVLADPMVDWKDPEQRARAVARMQAAEDREMEQAIALARKLGKPLREELPDGRVRVLVGLEPDGGLRYYVDRNADAAISTASDKVHIAPFYVDGSGVKVGVWENGSPRETHVEFNEGPSSRVNLVQGTALSSHASHVTGIIAAFGVDPLAKGMAYQTIVDAYTTGSDRTEMTAAAATGSNQHATKIYVSNHSYGYTFGWDGNEWIGSGTDQNAYDPEFGKYNWWSREFDTLLYNSPYYLAFWAAGNENTNKPSNGQSVVIGGNTYAYNSAIHPPGDGEYSGGFDTLGDHTTAKNLLVVGAVNDGVTNGQRDPSKATKANFSSTGPCDDGRIKPDVVGNGVNLFSTGQNSDTHYFTTGGTSMSTPNVVGTAALLVDLYRDRFSGGAMRASTLRGLLIHTATDIGNPGPDYLYGWGLVDAEKAAQHIQRQADKPVLDVIVEDAVTPTAPSQTITFQWDGSSPIRATLAWTDPAGPQDSAHNDRTPDLVNDLNLKLIAPDGTTEYFPYVMPFVGTWTIASMSEYATTGVNNVDNVEQVLVESPVQIGLWQAEVTYSGSLTNNEQEYGLHISGSTIGGRLISPNPGSLQISTNFGTNAAPQSFTIQNAGDDTINYTISDDVTWLSCSPTSGSSTGEANTINVTFSTSGLSIGSHTATITITDPDALNSPVTVPVTLNVLANIPFAENFDSLTGSDIPESWSELIAGGALWNIQTGGRTGGSNPSTAHSGTKNATLYDESTSPDASRLITPLINIENYDNLVMTFWHTQRAWSSDQDELKVYYSVDNGDSWVELAHYTSSISSWTQRSLNLPSGSNTIRVAFEGIAKYGYGVCVDTVSIDGDYVGSVLITESGGSTDLVEGGATDSYTVVLGLPPTDDVTITIGTDSQVDTDKSSLIFTTGNWATPQLVTVTAMDDAVIEPPHTGTITHSASSLDPKYNAVSIDDVVAAITDNDNTPPAVYAGADQSINLTNPGQVPWSPAKTTTALWLDADDAATITRNGSTVAQWDDKSGNNRHATQATASSQPTETASGLNGQTVLTFDGSSDFLDVDLNFTSGASHSAFIVLADVTNYSNIYGAANGGSGSSSIHVGFSSSSSYRMNFWNHDYTPSITSNFDSSGSILNYIWNIGSQKQVFSNGFLESGTAQNALAPALPAGGGRIANVVGQGFIGAKIAEIIIVSGTVSSDDRERFEGYLAHKWGLTANLPTAHPYKNTAPQANGLVAVANLDDASASDNDGHSLITQWTLIDGSAGVVFNDDETVNTSASFAEEGVYTLRLTADDGFSQPHDEVTITVNPQIGGRSFTYTGNGNSSGEAPVDPLSPYQDGATVTVLGSGDLVKTGHSFAGWNTSADGTGTPYALGATFTINADTTLHAQWTPITYIVTFDPNGGDTPNPQTKQVTYGSTYGTLATVSRTDYSFEGWFTAASGGAEVTEATTVTTAANHTLHAVWDQPPTVLSLSPVDGSTGVGTGANLSITFNENVAFGTGAIILRQSGGALVESFDVSGPAASLSLSGDTVTINPTSVLGLGTTYYVEIDATAIEDLTGNSFAGISGDGTWSFTTVLPDTTPPAIQSLSPANSANNIAVGSGLTITFNEPVVLGTGSITLRQSGGALVEIFDVGAPSPRLSLSGASLAIDPTDNLSPSTSYYLEIAATAIEDLAGNPFAGISGSGTWGFTTAVQSQAARFDYGGPSTPVQADFTRVSDPGGTATSNGITISSSPDFEFRDRTAQINGEGFGSDPQVNLLSDIAFENDSSSITFTLTGLTPFAEYAVVGYAYDADFSNDSVVNNWTTNGGTVSHGWEHEDITTARFEMANLTADADGEATIIGSYNVASIIIWNGFKIVALSAPDTTPPTLSSTDPADQATDVSTSVNLVATFDEDIAAGSGVVTIRNLNDATESTIDITDSTRIAISGTTLTIHPSADLAEGKNYAVRIAATAIQDTSGNAFAGISDDTTWNFSTTAPTFGTWIGSFSGLGGLTALGDDPDGDGIKNGIENFFGTHPGEFSRGITAGGVTHDGNTTFSFTHPLNPSPASDLSATYRWSKDLTSFHGDGVAFEGTTVTFVRGAAVDGIVTVAATVTGTPLDRLFIDIEVTEE